MSQVLEDYGTFQYKITERANGRLKIHGIYQLAEIVNKNKRVYTRGLWEKLLAEGSGFIERLRNRRVLGELGHPKDGKTDLSKVSHLVTNVWMDEARNPDCIACKTGSNPHAHIMAEEEVLDTPHGKILASLYEAGVQLGVSSRGQGSVRAEGDVSYVNDDYRLETFDHVLDPSTPGAYPRVMSESVVHAVEKLISPACHAAELLGYRNILGDVVQNDTSEDMRRTAQTLIEAIDVKLAAPTCEPAQEIKAQGSVTITTDGTVNINTVDPVNIGPRTIVPQESDNKGETSMSDTITLENAAVKNLVAAEVARVSASYDDKLATAYGQLERLREDLKAAEAKYSAAEALGTELLARNKENELCLKAYKESVDSKFSLHDRYEAAKKVIDELVNRVRQLKVFEKRSSAADRLLAEFVARNRRARLVQHVENLLKHEDAERSKKMKLALLRCESIAEANEQYSVFKTLSEETKTTKAPVEETKETKEVKTEGPLPKVGAVLEQTSVADKTPTTTSVNEDQDVERTRLMLKRMRTHTPAPVAAAQ